MKTVTLASLFSIGLVVATQVVAAPSEELIAQYNLAAEGDEDKVEVVHQQLETQIATDGADPLSLVYLGSTQTLMGRDAFMPWNKMKYTEQGLATISKGLDLLSSQATPLEQQEYRQGLPESLLARSIAGATFTSLPDMFNHFERGYDVFLDLLADESFKQQHYDAISWVYIYAIQAALRAEDKPQAKQWVAEMQARNPNHPMTVQAKAILDSAA
ncbi:hypothetical protein L1D13_16385 [Vibrio tubiashii]|uniref:hypothetical protein n=1 Tax=Vibrio tubiashii TaxID=29498 RepID=UPI001EFE9CDC|nr:hypothetical protein [Vibrio tubiashii]MCG9580472.1 hypothetical protein [Vibrio tubiashii]MCG9614063.1 hypothetical protein [Vibrio tubiashii]MCG9688492.1 hypothetical protein [Vibrio tubiashii]